MRVAIAGASLAGLSCGKYLTDALHTPVVVESQDALTALVRAWQNNNGDWYDKGLQVFCEADFKMLQLFKQLTVEERLQPEKHQTFNQSDKLHMYSKLDLHNLKNIVTIIFQSLQLIYKASGCQNDCSTQQISNNFYLSQSYTMQPYLGSMEGAVLSGKLTAQAINAAHQSASYSLQMQNIQPATNAATA